ncbi:MAG: helix-turn-helix domain-containing protein [Lachnospiraceae bacterium]|nr:helix-turn-helix domain-containing protein [Lachnospiraceae bacterium]
MERSMANRITELLSTKSMTQKELAQASGITESAISHYIKGDRIPRGVNLIKIAEALDTTVDYLLKQEENDKDTDMKVVKTLIARNAEKMTKAEKMELFSILIDEK